MCKYFLFGFLLLSFLFSHPVVAQNDSIAEYVPPNPKEKEDKLRRRKLNRKPRIALILSAVAPGAGQIYNKKYWKAPIIWVGLGAVAYFYFDNLHYFNQYNTAYKNVYYQRDSLPVSLTDHGVKHNFYNIDQLSQGANTYRRYRDLSLIIGAAIYVLNMVDANVDAHLKEFDLSDDLSLSIRPLLYANLNRQFTTGLTLNFTLKK